MLCFYNQSAHYVYYVKWGVHELKILTLDRSTNLVLAQI